MKVVGNLPRNSVEGLKSKNAYWDEGRPEIIESLNQNPKNLEKDALVALVLELDRRFMQLWDKVKFERENNLVDYEKLKK